MFKLKYRKKRSAYTRCCSIVGNGICSCLHCTCICSWRSAFTTFLIIVYSVFELSNIIF